MREEKKKFFFRYFAEFFRLNHSYTSIVNLLSINLCKLKENFDFWRKKKFGKSDLLHSNCKFVFIYNIK